MKYRVPLLSLLAFILLAIVMTWPVVPRLGTELAGGRDDLWVHQWTFWWVKQALLSGQNPFHTTLLYFPTGAELTSHNIAWFNIALWLPLQALFGRIVAYNLVFLSVFVLNGWCMFLFARDWLPKPWAAFAAGVVFGFWPYTMSHYDHSNMMVLFWVPLVLLFTGRTLQSQRWRDALLVALFLGLLGVTRWQLVVMSAPLMATFAGYVWLTRPETRQRRTLGLLATAVGLAVLIMLPLALPLLVDQFSRTYPQDTLLDERIFGRTDLAAYLTPSINSGLWAARVAERYSRFTVNQFYTPFLGFTSLVLALLGVVRRWKHAWFWLTMALFYVLLALGPELAVNGVAYPAVPMPARLVDDTLFYQVVRRPDRFNLFLGLPFAMLVGWGFDVVLGWRRRQWAHALAAVLGVVLLVETTAVPYATTPIITPAWEAARAANPWPAATLDIPINDRSYDKWYMLYQTTHGRPLATGHVSRMPRETFAFLDSVPFVAAARASDSVLDTSLPDVGHQLKLLADTGIEAIVIHKAFANAGLQAVWRDWLGTVPRHEDDDVIVFATAPIFGTDYAFDATFAPTAEIGLISQGSISPEAVQGGSITAPLRWGTRSRPKADYAVCLQLANGARVVHQRCTPIDALPTSDWLPNDIVRATHTLDIPTDLPPGDYTLNARLALDGSFESTGAPVFLGTLAVQPYAPQFSTDLQWENGIALTGFSAAPGIDLTLYWQTAVAQPASYKIFVHVVDPATGSIVAQSDHIPRGWHYPTTAWQPGEIVADRLTLPDVPPGRYALRVGLYDEATGARVPVRGQDFATLATIDEAGHVTP